MKDFVFRFESILAFRRSRRDQCLAELQQALQMLKAVESSRSVAEARLNNLLRQAARQAQPGALDVAGLQDCARLIAQLRTTVAQLHRQQAAAVEQVESAREATVLAEKSIRTLESLEDRERREWMGVRGRLEQTEREDVWQSGQAVRPAIRL